MIRIYARGLTLVELMVVVAVLAILLTVGVPSLTSMFESYRVIDVTEEFYSQLQFARISAISRSQAVYFNTNANGTTTWQFGISTNSACDPSDNDPACSMTVDDGTGADVAVTHRTTNLDHPEIKVATTDSSITFDPVRGTAESATFTITSDGANGYEAKAIVGALGQVSLCSNDIAKYESCP